MKPSPEIRRYLEMRGLKDDEAQRRFLYPRLSDHYDPFLLKDMNEAIERMKTAVKKQKKILIWGDADLDGISSAVIMKSALNDLGARSVKVRIPTRDSMGFGLIEDEIRNFKQSGGDMIVTVDVGISNRTEARIAQEIGLELIITDHHELIGAIPEAILVDPKRDSYPFKELAGAGVVLKVISALYEHTVGLSVDELARLRPHYWMLATLGTVSDRCPLVDENRLIVYEGLSRFEEGGWKPLAIWLDEMGFDAANLTVFDLYSRGIAPFYSTDPEEVVELLLSGDEDWMRTRYAELKELAESWQRGKQYMITEAFQAARYIGGIVVSVTEWTRHDYLGTATHALREQYGRNAIALAPRENTWRAECRGLDNSDLLGYLAGFEEMYISYGGHRKACGFTLKPGYLEAFLSALEKNPLQHPDEVVDAEKAFEVDLSSNLMEWTLLAPFGEANPPPRLHAKRAKIVETPSGFFADGKPCLIPLSLRQFFTPNGRYDLDYTVMPDGSVRVLQLEPVG